MRISDWSSDVCSSDLLPRWAEGSTAQSRREELLDSRPAEFGPAAAGASDRRGCGCVRFGDGTGRADCRRDLHGDRDQGSGAEILRRREGASRQIWPPAGRSEGRSEEHTSELQSLMRISYAVFCLKKKIYNHTEHVYTTNR